MSDLSLSGEDLLLQLINTANPHPPYGPLTSDQITFGTPLALSNDLSGKNASIVLSAVTGEGYIGTQTSRYNRLDLQSVFFALGVASVSFPNQSYARSTDLLDYLNTTYTLNLTEADVVDEELPDADVNGTISYSLTAHPNSLVYVGTLPLSITASIINLPRAFVMQVLNGFVPPDTNRINLASVFTISTLDGFTVADLTA